MSFEVVELDESFVAGLTVPLAGVGVTRRDLEIVKYTWDRYRARGDERSRVAAYIAQADNSIAVVGYVPGSLDDVAPGDVVARIPAGKYAKFRVVGEPLHATRAAWTDILQSERAGEFERTYAADFERYDQPGTVEVYVSIA
ncbi:GyrI-like domain-containing protein [Aldersonia kunmingensis]|uniref:GyrI-like domain-containing protein n=1 Tax=Aldersonia kunmingensis TaxID=408066 RepID=UPI00082ED6B0|nr:GyrI-like domain-containing protein [Aldersonia kunmingensis]